MRLNFEDVAVGDELPALVRGPISPMHMMRWSSTIENWHRIHYDWRFATEHDGLPDVLINGSFKQHLLVQLVRQWAGDDGWLWRMSYRFKKMDIAWDTLTATGQVIEVRAFNADFGVAALEIGITNSRGERSTEGTALAALPYRSGLPVPYPFPEGLTW